MSSEPRREDVEIKGIFSSSSSTPLLPTPSPKGFSVSSMSFLRFETLGNRRFLSLESLARSADQRCYNNLLAA